MKNYLFQPGQQAPYETYQPPEGAPPPPPPPYRPTNPYAPPTIYGPIHPYAPTSQAPSYQPTYPYVVVMLVQPTDRLTRKLFLGIAGLVALLLIVGVATAFITQAAPGVVPPPAPIPHYPSVASAYNGTAHNTLSNSDANIAITSMVQTTDKINGTIEFGLPLVGSGPFTGTVSRSGAVQFTSSSKDNGKTSVTFIGSIVTAGSMSGTYTVMSNGQKGTWKATPTTHPVVYPTLSRNYLGEYMNTATGKNGILSLQMICQNQQNFHGFAFADAIPVKGTVGSDNSIQFAGTYSKGVVIKFTGTANSDGSLSGSYIASAGGMGTWKMSPA